MWCIYGAKLHLHLFFVFLLAREGCVLLYSFVILRIEADEHRQSPGICVQAVRYQILHESAGN